MDATEETSLRVPEGHAVYAIGDIHGCLAPLERLERRILADATARGTKERIIVYLGDYIDRGPDSAGVLDHLIERPLPGFHAIHLCGNHEDYMLRFLADPSVGSDWHRNGGDATLGSYGLDPVHEWGRLRAELARTLPIRHRAFLEGLRLFHVEGDYLFVHAGIRPGLPLERQSREDLLWIRGSFLNSDLRHEKIVVHGHSITRDADVRPNRIGIDTGAFMSGRLTCLALEGTERRLLSS